MPFKSKSQAKWMFAAEDRGELPEGTASEWAHHTPGGIKKLPQHVKKHKKAEDLSVQAANLYAVTKVASAYHIQPRDVADLGTLLGTDATGMALSALADPTSFTQLLKFAADGTLDANLDGLKRFVAAERTPMPTMKTAAVLDALKAVKAANDRKTIEKNAAAVMRKLIVKKAAEHYRGQMVTYLDKLASDTPLTKQASIRAIQGGIARGLNLHQSLKLAFDHLNDYQLGRLASDLVRAAVQYKQANALMGMGGAGSTAMGGATGGAPAVSGAGAMPTQGPMSATGPAASSGDMMGKMAATMPGQPPQESGSSWGGTAGGIAGMLAGMFAGRGGMRRGPRGGWKRGPVNPMRGMMGAAVGGIGGTAAGNTLAGGAQQAQSAHPMNSVVNPISNAMQPK